MLLNIGKKDKPAPPTAEELAERLKEQQAKDQQGFDKNLAGHLRRCDRWRPLWHKRITDIMAEEAKAVAAARKAAYRKLPWHKAVLVKLLSWFGLQLGSFEDGLPKVRTYEQIAAQLAQNARDDVEELEREVFTLVTRTGMLLSATTLLFAVFALRSTSSKSGWATTGTVTLAIALLIAAVAFVTALFPLRPPLYRAWKVPYELRAYKTLLMHDDFNIWVWYTWLGDRRTPVAQAYKKAHAVAVPMLIIAAILTVPGLGLSLIFR